LVEVRAGERDLPLRSDAPLQTIIREWDSASQAQVLRPRLTELGLLRLNVDPDLLKIVDGYRTTLASYLDELSASDSIFSLRSKARRISRSGEAAIRQLDALDAQRKALRMAVVKG